MSADAIGNLRAATNALQLIRRRDARAWPIAEVLAEMWQEGALRRMLKVRGPTPAFVPTTEADLVELFGAPGVGFKQPKPARVLRLERGGAKREGRARGDPFAACRPVAEARL